MATITLALFGVSAGAVGAQSEPVAENEFPTGTFVADFAHADRYLEFTTDGTCRWVALDGFWERPCTYATNGDLFTEMTFEWPDGPQVPATYYWDWDGERLSFELWGDDLQPSRYGAYAGHPLRLVEDGRVVYAATSRIAPGTLVAATRRFLPADELPPDAIEDLSEFRGRAAAVAIERGQPITPDMLEPASE